MKKIIGIILVATVTIAAADSPSLQSIFDAMTRYERDANADAATLKGLPYVSEFGYHKNQTVVLANTKLVIVLPGTEIVIRGDVIEYKGGNTVRIGGRKFKVVRTFVYKPAAENK